MTIKEMHYDFKRKLNKIDSQQYANLVIPEIDWILNEAVELFVKLVAKPREKSFRGFEKSQRSIDDVRTLVVNETCITINDDVATLPENYWHFVRADVYASKGVCENQKLNFHVRQHDDDFEESPFDRSNFEWRKVNGVFFDQGVKFYTDGTFVLEEFCMSYIRKHVYMHNAEDFRNGSYSLPSGVFLEGTQNCELPEHTHREIVDIAVLMATGEMQVPDYQVKLQKLNFNKLT